MTFFMNSCIPSSKAAAWPSSVSHWANISVPGTSTACSTSRSMVWTCWQVSSAGPCWGSIVDLIPVLGRGDDRFAQSGSIHLILTGSNQPTQILDDARAFVLTCALGGRGQRLLTAKLDTVHRGRK